MQSLNWATLQLKHTYNRVGIPNMSEVLFLLKILHRLCETKAKSKINKMSAECRMLLTTIDISQSKKIRNSHNN